MDPEEKERLRQLYLMRIRNAVYIIMAADERGERIYPPEDREMAMIVWMDLIDRLQELDRS